MTWKAYIDGGSRGNPGKAGAGVYMLDGQNRPALAAGFYLGRKTNNEAEYQGLLNSLRLLKAAGAEKIHVFSDSELLVRQINGEYRVKAPGLKPLFEQAKAGLARFGEWRITHVYREQNTMADSLANRAMDMGEDVVESDVLSLLKLEGPNSESESVSGPPVRSGSARPTTVEVRVVRAPEAGKCAADMALGRVFIFSEVTPANFCMRAIPSVCKDVISMQAALQKQDTTIIVKCEHPGCQAVFELRCRSSI